jgi:glycosyltransferase involved in cell wall biosynthesis
MKILVIGRSFAPGRGSEPGFTWNWATQWSRDHEVWVIAHPEFREEVEGELRRSPRSNLRIIWADIPRWMDPLRLSDRRMGVRPYYIFWQESAFRWACELHSKIDFDFVHHVSLGTVSAPPKLWRLGIPFIWGPIGGGQTTPAGFLRYFGKERVKEFLRNTRVRLLPLSPALRQAARRSLVMATNRETMSILKRAGATKVHSLLDGALPIEYIPEAPITREARSGITFLWAGAFEPRKCLPLALEALSKTDPWIHLQVAGAGRKRVAWEKLAASLGLAERVHFLGLLTAEELRERFREADGFVFTSIRDSFGSVLLEAMAHALPVIALDHQGVAIHVPDGAAIKVPVTNPGETVASLASGMRLLGSSAELRSQMGRAAWEFARSQLWERKVAFVEELIGPFIATGATHANNGVACATSLPNP